MLKMSFSFLQSSTSASSSFSSRWIIRMERSRHMQFTRRDTHLLDVPMEMQDVANSFSSLPWGCFTTKVLLLPLLSHFAGYLASSPSVLYFPPLFCPLVLDCHQQDHITRLSARVADRVRLLPLFRLLQVVIRLLCPPVPQYPSGTQGTVINASHTQKRKENRRKDEFLGSSLFFLRFLPFVSSPSITW